MKFTQQPSKLFMVRPVSFGFNVETAQSNSFQKNETPPLTIVNEEFDRMIDLLQAHEIDVTVFEDSAMPVKPDAVFPNNWISTHEDGTVVLYPMMAENRRLERRLDIVEYLQKNYDVKRVIDLSIHEKDGKFLEGTGSLVFDHINKIGYACRSQRTSENLVEKICHELDYKAVIFDSVDKDGRPIYHTNVMMGIGKKFAVICLDSIRSESDQDRVLDSFAQTDHKIIAISYEQMAAFAGNLIEVKSGSGEPVVLISQTAFQSLLPGQLNAISEFSDVLPISIPLIETIGGGSVRCMVAGIHLPSHG